MWHSRRNEQKKGAEHGLVAVAVDSDKGSQVALKWAADNLLSKGQVVILIHVVHKHSYNTPPVGGSQAIICDTKNSLAGTPHRENLERQTKDLFLTFHCFCARKDIQCLDVILEDFDVAKALTDYASYAAIEHMVLGSPHKHGFIRFKGTNIPSSVSKGAPDFCSVYVISKGKVSSVRNPTHPIEYSSPLLGYIQTLTREFHKMPEQTQPMLNIPVADRAALLRPARSLHEDSTRALSTNPLRPPFGRWNYPPPRSDFSEMDTDISFVRSNTTSADRTTSVFYNYIDQERTSQVSTGSENNFRPLRLGPKFTDLSLLQNVSLPMEIGRNSWSRSRQSMDEVEAEMTRLKLELKQTMDMYHATCKESVTKKQTVPAPPKEEELNEWRLQYKRKVDETRAAEEKEKAMEAAKLGAEVQAQKSIKTETEKEMKPVIKVKEMKKMYENMARGDGRYRHYSFEEIELATENFADSHKIGEGNYGPVYKCYLDHTPVAVKVLRSDAAQGRSQFQQEVDILSRIRHPNMVLLLGACPEYSILVYEYMAKGSLDDNLFSRNNAPAMTWRVRFRIAAEIATGLLFLHQSKPEPLVHRDLKPGNILLDCNYVSKISDVGLARLVPATAENATQYHVTSTAGTFCYIDPEYQQTGMLGVKSDVYSLGIVLLQLITAKRPMGLAHYVGNAIERGTFRSMLDPAVRDWPFDETLCFAKLALQCTELRRKDRPDLAPKVLPQLNRLRDLADGNIGRFFPGNITVQSDVIVDSELGNSHYSTTSSVA